MMKEDCPLVSVLMTVYNREEFLAEAISSVIASTYTNWELILCDDGSTDKSFDIATRFAEKDSRIRLYKNENNLGDYKNRNKAASYSSGKYLKYVDADDKIYPYGLEQLVFYMEQFPDVGYGLCSQEQDKSHMFPLVLTPEATYKRHYLDNNSVFHKAPLSSIIRREIFEKESGFADVRHYGDSELWHRLSLKYSVLLMPHGIVWYRFSDGQEASIRKKNPLNIVKTLTSHYNLVSSDNSPLNEKDKHRVMKHLEWKISRATLHGFKNYGYTKGLEMYNYQNFGLKSLLMASANNNHKI